MPTLTLQQRADNLGVIFDTHTTTRAAYFAAEQVKTTALLNDLVAAHSANLEAAQNLNINQANLDELQFKYLKDLSTSANLTNATLVNITNYITEFVEGSTSEMGVTSSIIDNNVAHAIAE